MTSAKQEHELQVFRHFLTISDLGVRRETIRLGDADVHEPDIVCEIDGIGAAGFELTRIAEQDFMSTRARWAAIDGQLRADFASLAPSKHATLSRQYGNAQIGVALAFGRGMSQARAAVLRVFDILESLPANFAGQHVIDLAGRRDAIQWISVTRHATLQEPILYVVHPASWVTDVTAESIAAKLAKTYSAVPSRRELIAYFAEQPPTLDDVRLPAIDQYLRTLNDLGPFKRLWIVNLWSGKVERTHSGRSG